MSFHEGFPEADLFLAPLSCQLKRGAWPVGPASVAWKQGIALNAASL